VAALFAVVSSAQNNPLVNDPQAAGLGKGAFRILCAPCHGIRAQGGRGPDLTRGVFNSGEQDSDLFKVISEGVPGTEMGAYGARLSDEYVWRLVSYIRSTSHANVVEKVEGDPASGEEIFWKKADCGACHAIGNRGGRSGPNLTRIGRQRSLAYLRESIAEPSRDITPGYNTLTIVTRDGKKISGIERGLDNFTVQVSDLSGNFYSFDKSDLRSVTRESTSLMPAGYSSRLTPQELNHLLAYLLTLKGARP
jgi:putative heme-binding domain-containing protein